MAGEERDIQLKEKEEGGGEKKKENAKNAPKAERDIAIGIVRGNYKGLF